MLCVMLVNGWTDAPNAIATAVATRALSFRGAAALAAVCEFLGVVAMTAISPAVAETLYGIADFGGDPHAALTALCAALAAVILWASAAWRFGIPTSESHALMAGLMGAAVSLQGRISAVDTAALCKVVLGLVLSTGLGFGAGRYSVRLLRRLFPSGGHRTQGRFRRAQIAGAAGMSFFHGAQDGQKFIGVFLLGISLSSGRPEGGPFFVPLWLMAVCALMMALGTLAGGRRIVDTVGQRMAPLGPRQGVAADLAGGVCLLFACLFGLPVSTTHTKITAIMGVGVEETPGQVDYGVVRSICTAWLLTFPGCFVLGGVLFRLFLGFYG